MDSIRGQSFNTAGPGHIHDSNVAGRSMLEVISKHSGDESAKDIADKALERLGKSYTRAPGHL